MVGMYRISVIQIWPEPDLAGFMTTNPAGAGLQNLVQHNSKVIPNAAVCL